MFKKRKQRKINKAIKLLTNSHNKTLSDLFILDLTITLLQQVKGDSLVIHNLTEKESKYISNKLNNKTNLSLSFNDNKLYIEKIN